MSLNEMEGIHAVGQETSKSLGLVVLDDMIARAEAVCERGKGNIAMPLGVSRLVAFRRRAQLQTMEDTLARLKAQRVAAEP